MAQNHRVNISSLNLVSDELVATVETAASKLEQFVASPANSELLETCIAAIEQISGTLRLIQLTGADLLADEILQAARNLNSVAEQQLSQWMDVLTGAFFILPRYLEYTQQTRRSMPVLLVPYINELRQLNGRPPIAESHFFHVELDVPYRARSAGSAIENGDMAALIRRLRHMFQVGLLNVLQGKQARSALGIMQRALERLEVITGDRPLARLWWLGSAAIEMLRINNMELNKSRKLCLTALDRHLKAVQNRGVQAFEDTPPAELMRALLFVIALSHKPSEKAQSILDRYGIQGLGYSDQDLRNEREALKGPNLNTVASVAAVLQDELRSIKEILENASLADDKGLPEYSELAAHLTKVADILSVVGLASASNTLKEEAGRILSWHEAGEPADAAQLIGIADALLYVESTVAGLDSLNVSEDRLAQANLLARREVIATSQRVEAELLVIKEAESGLALVKRALSAFAESNYDHGHIKNVGATLTAVRGGMTMLGLHRAAAVVAACVEFIEDTLLVNDQPVALQQLLETFADAVIGLEYYLDAVREDRNCDDSVLDIAEESLQALGHRVK